MYYQRIPLPVSQFGRHRQYGSPAQYGNPVQYGNPTQYGNPAQPSQYGGPSHHFGGVGGTLGDIAGGFQDAGSAVGDFFESIGGGGGIGNPTQNLPTAGEVINVGDFSGAQGGISLPQNPLMNLPTSIGQGASQLGIPTTIGGAAGQLGIPTTIGGAAGQLGIPTTIGGAAGQLGIPTTIGGAAGQLGIPTTIGGAGQFINEAGELVNEWGQKIGDIVQPLQDIWQQIQQIQQMFKPCIPGINSEVYEFEVVNDFYIPIINKRYDVVIRICYPTQIKPFILDAINRCSRSAMDRAKQAFLVTAGASAAFSIGSSIPPALNYALNTFRDEFINCLGNIGPDDSGIKFSIYIR